jgi:N-acetylmuramoyl-L-alanine amidase
LSTLSNAGYVVANDESAPPRPVFDTVITRTPAAKPKPKAAPKPATAGISTDGATATAVGAPSLAGAVAGATVEVQAVRVEGDAARTRIAVSMSKGVRAEVFTLANPYRVVVDLPDAAFTLPDGTGRAGAGLISAFRYGLFAERKSRIVLDAAGPVRIDEARMAARGSGPAVDLTISLAPVSAEAFGAGTGAGVTAAGAAAAKPPVFEDAGAKPASARPVILIDPGHGGIDPGALGASNLLEKAVVLAVAQKIKRRLDALGRYDVRLTRTGDVFVSLDQRVKMSREAGADLFVSLHADSIASKTYAPVVRGASVYTLSEQASDEQARLMAEKENASDLLAGIDLNASSEGDEVRSILIDLMKRETANYSADFSRMLTGSMRKAVSLSRDPQRSAAFKVLRQTHAPSVLVELGFMSNEADETLMRQADWQSKVAQSIAAAIETFFDKRTARAP